MPRDSKNTQRLEKERDKAISMLVIGMRPPQVAEAVGVTRQTIHRWLKEPEFSAKLRDLQDAALSEAGRIVQHAVTGAVSTLIEICEDPNAEAKDRIKAASEILDRAGIKELGRQEIPAEATVIDVTQATDLLRRDHGTN